MWRRDGLRIRRLWHAESLPHGVDVRCHVDVPSWIRIRSMGVMRTGTLDWGDRFVFSWRARWWCFWRTWSPS